MRNRRKAKRTWRGGAPRLGGEALEARYALHALPIIEPTVIIWEPPNPFLTDTGFEAVDDDASGKGNIDRLIVHFNRDAETTDGATGAHSILNPANWRLTRDGIDVSSLIATIEFSGAWGNFRATVSVSTPLGPGHYQLIARDTIQDSQHGQALDGDNDKLPGGDAVNAFAVSSLVAKGDAISVGSSTDGGNSVATDANGNYVVVWQRAPLRDPLGIMPVFDNRPSIVAQRYNAAGEAVGELIEVSAGNSGWGATVAMNAAGEFVVSWSEAVEIGGASSVFFQRFHADGTAASERVRVAAGYTPNPLTDVMPHYLSAQDVGIDGAGNVVVVWQDAVATQKYVHVSRYSSSGMLLGHAMLGEGQTPRLAVNAAGQFAVIWLGELEVSPATSQPYVPITRQHVYLQNFRADGGTASGVVQVDASGRNSAADVGIDGAGNVVVVWANSENGDRLLGRRISPAGVPLAPAIEIDGGAATQALSFHPKNPAVSVDSQGNFAVVWSAFSHATNPLAFYSGLTVPESGVIVRMFDAGGRPFDDAQAVNGFARAGGKVASVALSDSGDLVTAWGTQFYFSPLILPRIDPTDWPFPTSEAQANHAVIDLPSYFNNYAIRARQFTVRRDLRVDLNGDWPSTDYMANYRPDGGAVSIVGPDLRINAFGTQPTSATATIESFLAGDLLAVNTAGTNLTATFVNGVLTITGDDSTANYELVLRSITFSSTAGRGPGSNVRIKFAVSDGAQTSPEAESTVSIYQPGLSTIVGRQIFYNNSSYDGNDPAAGASDDAAIATDKVALRVGETATFANYTSYHRGINGILIDLAGGHGTLTANNFQFKVGNSNNSSGWSYAPPPLSIVVRSGAGLSGSDRIEIIWADFAITNTWLEVAVAANGNTGLAQSDTFYFGNAVGETGNATGNAQVNALDFLQTVNHLLANPGGAVDIASPYDFNRDGVLNSQDFLVSIHSVLTFRPTLALIAPPSSSVSPGWGLVMVGMDYPITIVGVPFQAIAATYNPPAPDLPMAGPATEPVEPAAPAAQSAPHLLEQPALAADEDGEEEDWLAGLFD